MEVWIRQSMAYRVGEERMPTPVPGHMWERERGPELYSDRMRFIRRVEELGFDGLIFTEHHSGPNGGLTPSPIVMLAAASQVTERMKLATMGIQLPTYPHPIRVAEELAMIDNLSGGRLVVGLISTGAPGMFTFNIPAEEERDRYHESFDLIRKAWTEPEPFEWRSKYYDYDSVSILPRPVQQPYPEVWTTCSSEQSLQWAARNHIRLLAPGTVTQTADILNYYRMYAEERCGWTPTAEDLGVAREFYITPTMTSLEELVDDVLEQERRYGWDFDVKVPKYKELARFHASERTYEYGARAGRPAGGGRSETGFSGGQFLIGDPEAITQQILEQREACGNPGVLVIRPEVGHLSIQEVGDRLELFAKEVMPTIQAL
jgi:alkanesulfonate monooxygenase SsuD/methylene tetrahydromethanopterin reductase-like flavin-dependent oxidoreductase (luciferase family)